jgi:hypothetical protein
VFIPELVQEVADFKYTCGTFTTTAPISFLD